MTFFAPKTIQYEKFRDASSTDSSERLLESETETSQIAASERTHRPTWLYSAGFLLVCMLMTGGMSAWLSVLWHPPYLRGIELKSHEFAPARRYIEMEIQKFTGTAIFEEDGRSYRERVPGVKEYIGNSSTIDENWENLFRDRYFLIDEHEAKAIWPEDYQNYYHHAGGWWMGLDVFHTLHCVNRIRVALNDLRAGIKNDTSFNTYHEDHCLDIIRQSIQCSADLTPIPERRWPSVFNHFIDSDQKHTCRNIWTLRKFLDLRKKKTDDIIARIEADTGRKFVEEESAMGVIGFPERAGHESDYRPAY